MQINPLTEVKNKTSFSQKLYLDLANKANDLEMNFMLFADVFKYNTNVVGEKMAISVDVFNASKEEVKNSKVLMEEFLEKKLNYIVGQSNEITLPNVGDSGSVLTLTGANSDLFPATFSLSNNQVMLDLPGEANDASLTSNRVKVTEFSIIHISSLPAIRVTLALSSINLPAITLTNNFSYVISQ